MSEHEEDITKNINDALPAEGSTELVEVVSEMSQNDLQIEPKPGLIERLKAKKGIWSVLAGGLLFLAKFKFVIVLILTKLKFLLIVLKLSKFASTAISMTIMIWVYATIYGIKFGIGFVLLLFIHEMGHYAAARKLDMNVSLPLFIPFVGALINLREEPKDAVTEAKMAIAGPIAGSLGALLCYILYVVTGTHFFAALAYTGFFLNIFNLIPVHPLDGGRTVSAISPKMWLIGIAIGIVAVIKFFNPILLFILIMGVVQLISHWKDPKTDYYNVEPNMRIIFAILYFGLLILLGGAMVYTHGIAGAI